MMSRFGIHHLPVVDNHKPVSMVCDRDLTVAEAIFREGKEAHAAHVVRLLGDARIHRVHPSDSLNGVLAKMFSERLDAVLIVDKDALIGIFTAIDACRILADALPRPAGDTT
jgi:CBS domain-containing protein